jgi:hypothetical protein
MGDRRRHSVDERCAHLRMPLLMALPFSDSLVGGHLIAATGWL